MKNQNVKEPFYLNNYLMGKQKVIKNEKRIDNNQIFIQICNDIKKFFNEQWEKEQGEQAEQSNKLLLIKKNAIIGHETEVNYFKDRIKEYLKLNNLQDSWFPEWYEDVTSAIFHENWGLAGLANWKNIKNSSSAKIIGDRIYYLINGKQILQKQKITYERYEQLKRALLLKDPRIRNDKNYVEVYMLTGERISIFSGDRVKEGQPSMVFRKYIVNVFTFEEQAKRRTILKEMIPMLKSMVKIGYNVAFVGPVRSSKTTFLTTWQSYEDPSLEGVMVETDPEIPIHLIMPTAPIMQLIADGEDLVEITKSILRSDADYLIMAEARDGYANNLSVEMANKGTRRCKTTIHLTDVEDFCYDVANKIVNTLGGELNYQIVKVAKSFNYVFQFCQLADKSKKRLKGIYEIRYNRSNYEITIHQICKYNYENDGWTFKYDIGQDKEVIGVEENIQAFNSFKKELKNLSEKFPMSEDNVFRPIYGRGAING